MSIGASGKLADTLVFSAWKGIKYARQYVVPANPNTAGQQTQRGYITAAVALWHDTTNTLTTLDKTNPTTEEAAILRQNTSRALTSTAKTTSTVG